MNPLAGRAFRAVSNSANGAVGAQTIMRFASDDNGVVTGVYSGGAIVTGHVLAKRTDDGGLDMLYQAATAQGQIHAGRATARFEHSPAGGGVTMHLDWQWLTGDQSRGQSIWESL